MNEKYQKQDKSSLIKPYCQTTLQTIIIVCTLLLCSCDANKEKVIEVAQQFSQAIVEKDKVALFGLYPQIRDYKNLQIPTSLSSDNITIDYNKEDTTYTAMFNSRQSIEVKVLGTDKFEIVDSRNIMKVDSISRELAAKTGAPINEMSDIEAAKLLSDDSYYIRLLVTDHPQAANGNLVHENGRYHGKGGWYPDVEFDLPVTNYGSNPVKGEDYSIEVIYTRSDNGGRVGTDALVGFDLAPNETYVYTTHKPEFYRWMNEGIKVYVQMNILFKNASKTVLLEKYGDFNGKEYERYLSKLPQIEEFKRQVELYKNAVTRKLSEDDLKGMPKEDLRLVRNYIFANHGYIFKDKELADYFARESWYNGTTKDMDEVYKSLNEYEKYNVDFIKKFE